MQRPGSSRGGAMPASVRPPSASIRAAANAGAQGGFVPPSTGGMRPPTSSLRRVGTASGNNPIIAPINTNVSLEARPVTQQGLEGMRARTAMGPGRQIADKSYYLSELRAKMSDLQRETRSLQEESERAARDAQVYSALERRYEERVSEVRVLEGQLADFNLAFDKVRTGAELGDVRQQQQRLAAANEHERRRLDEVFLRRADAEQRARSAELEIESIHRRNEQRMQSLGEELRSEYVELQQENMHLNHEIMAREQRSSMLDDRLFAAQSELKKDIYANIYRGAKLQKQHAQLEQEQRRLEEETSTALTPDEMRERLMAKVQEDNAYIENAQRHLEQLEALCSTHEETLRQKRAQLTDSAKGSEHTTNYEKLVERDKKITEFLTTFPQERTDAQTQKDNLQASIVGLLNHISKGMGVQQSLQAANVPSSAALGDLKDELGFKKEQMQNSEQTLSHLQKELEKRQAELDKINALDSKISVELTTLNDKVKEMESDLVKFSNIDAQVQMANDQKKSLLMEKQRCKSKRDALQARAALCQQKLERQKQELQDSDVYKKLDALEQKARANGQNIYTIADFVTTRERETDYEEIQKHSLQLTQQINQLLVQQPV